MRTVHRICAIGALFLMLWMGLSGLLMQADDLRALLSGERGDTPTMQALNEGKYGAGRFAVISLADYAAQALPADLDHAQAFATTMQALERQQPGLQPFYAELRMENGRVIGKVATAPAVQRGPRVQQEAIGFDALTGTSVSTTATLPIGPPLPPSARNTGLEFHRFFSHGAGVGVWFMLLSGIVIWVMLVTGLGFYFKMLKARSKIGRNGLFWSGGGTWRSLHRGVSVGSAVFIILIAFSGTWMAAESVWHSFHFTPPRELAAPLNEAQVQLMAAGTLKAFQAQHPDTPINAVRVRYYSGIPQGVVITGGEQVTQRVYHTETGAVQSLTEAGYPPSRFPFGDQLHQSMKRFHSGADYGIAARVVSLLSGICLVYLAVSGLVMYFSMWSARRKSGRLSFVWR